MRTNTTSLDRQTDRHNPQTTYFYKYKKYKYKYKYNINQQSTKHRDTNDDRDTGSINDDQDISKKKTKKTKKMEKTTKKLKNECIYRPGHRDANGKECDQRLFSYVKSFSFRG